MLRIVMLLTVFVSGNCLDWALDMLDSLDISVRGNEQWMMDADRKIHHWENGKWVRKAGASKQLAASSDGWSWMVNDRDEVYRWNPNVQSWERMPGTLRQISAASRDLAVGTDSKNRIFRFQKTNWVQLPGSAAWVSVGVDGEILAAGPSSIMRLNSDDQWETIMHIQATQIDVHDAKHVVITDNKQQIRVWDGTVAKVMPGKARRCSIRNANLVCVGKTLVNTVANVAELVVDTVAENGILGFAPRVVSNVLFGQPRKQNVYNEHYYINPTYEMPAKQPVKEAATSDPTNIEIEITPETE